MPEIKPKLPRGRPMSALSLKIMALLEDGEWHDQNEIIEAAMLVVPPGEAVRIAEKARVGNAMRDGREVRERTKNTEYSQIVAVGQRSKTTQVIHSMHDNGRIEKRVVDGKKMLRLLHSTPRIIYFIDEDGNRTLNYPSRHILVTEIDMRQLRLASKLELESKLMELSTFPERFPKVMEIRKVIQDTIARRKIDEMMGQYTKDRDPEAVVRTCYTCGGPKPKDGYRDCLDCVEKRIENNE